MAVTLTLGGTDLNDGSTYTLQPGLDLGAREPEYDVWTSYTGDLARGPVRYGLVEMQVPILVRAASLTALASAVDALRSLVGSCSFASPGTLVYADDTGASYTYRVVDSPEPQVVRDELWYFGCATQVSLTLRRLP